MKRVFEFTPSDSEAMVSRILVVVHKAIDESFPEARPAPHRFAKTIFGDEPTVNQALPLDVFAQHPMNEDSLREVSDRLGHKTRQLSSDDLHVTSDSEIKHDEGTVTNTIFGLKERRYRQTLVGCLILVIGIILAYFLW